jgi:hypothetical protein
MTDTSAAAVAARAAEQLTAATSAMVTQGNIEAEEAEAKKKAEKAAKKKVGGSRAGLKGGGVHLHKAPCSMLCGGLPGTGEGRG